MADLSDKEEESDSGEEVDYLWYLLHNASSDPNAPTKRSAQGDDALPTSVGLGRRSFQYPPSLLRVQVRIKANELGLG